MEKRAKYIKNLESDLKKYKNKISKIDPLLKKYKAHNKNHLMAEMKDLKEKLKQAELIFKKLKSSSRENFEEIKISSAEIFDALKEAFYDFSNLLTKHLHYAKDEIKEYGNEKVTQVEDYIKEKPFTCAAWAFGIGFLIGKLLKRSK